LLCINISSTSGSQRTFTASLRAGKRRDGSSYVQVLYWLDGKQSSTSFEDLASAKKFQNPGRPGSTTSTATVWS
jgi:hypothetical protein